MNIKTLRNIVKGAAVIYCGFLLYCLDKMALAISMGSIGLLLMVVGYTLVGTYVSYRVLKRLWSGRIISVRITE